MIYYVVFGLTGILLGAVIGILLCQMDAKWKIASGFSSLGFIGSFNIVYSMFKDSEDIGKASCFVVFLASMILSIIIIFLIISKFFGKQGNYKLNFADILIGRKKTIEDYYKNIQSDVKEKREALNKRDRSMKLHEKTLDLREKHLIELNSKITEGLYIPLPIDYNLPINEEFLLRLPEFTENILNFSKQLVLITDDFLHEYTEDVSNFNTDLEFTVSYLRMVCFTTSVYLFDSLKDARTHIRILQNDKKYKMLVASTGARDAIKFMTDISVNRGMIYKAGQVKTSLIKSLNIAHHSKGKNDRIWKDYITLVFDKFYCGNKPYISMGISIKNTEFYGEYLHYLNYCRIESLIQEQLIRINDVCDIVNS